MDMRVLRTVAVPTYLYRVAVGVRAQYGTRYGTRVYSVGSSRTRCEGELMDVNCVDGPRSIRRPLFGARPEALGCYRVGHDARPRVVMSGGTKRAHVCSRSRMRWLYL